MDKKRHLAPILATIIAMTAMLSLVSCNKDTTPEEEPDYQRGTELTVSKFYLQANYKVMTNLDSVYFAIDLNRGVIFNADSLPIGTPINKLIPVITVPSSVETVEIAMEDEDGTREVIDYREHPSDTIDFTRTVTLELSALNGSARRSYRLLVNVHKMNPDSLDFNLEARTAFPSRMDAPQSQKTVSLDSTVYTFIKENDGSYTASTTRKIEAGQWTKKAVTPGFAPKVESFTATADALFMLGTDGTLYRSTDAENWQSVGVEPWESIIGGYGTKLQGVRNNGGKLVHTQYPLDGFAETPIASNFPYLESSEMAIYTTKWSSLPLGLIVGGQTQTGITGAMWAFDGVTWISISEGPMPPVKGGTLMPYYAYLKTSAMWLFNEYSIWMYIGGVKADGEINRTVYISYNNGVHWQEAPQAMQLSEDLTSLYRVGHVVANTPLEANFEPGVWNAMGQNRMAPRKLPYVINGYDILWNCPYIYLIGGYDTTDATTLNPWIYRGVINRMSFKPLI